MPRPTTAQIAFKSPPSFASIRFGRARHESVPRRREYLLLGSSTDHVHDWGYGRGNAKIGPSMTASTSSLQISNRYCCYVISVQRSRNQAGSHFELRNHGTLVRTLNPRCTSASQLGSTQAGQYHELERRQSRRRTNHRWTPFQVEGLLTKHSNSATVTGGAPRHTSSMSAGGPRQATTNNSPLLAVMAAPATTPHAPITITAAHHAPASRARDISFNIAVFSFGSGAGDDERSGREGDSNADWPSSGNSTSHVTSEPPA